MNGIENAADLARTAPTQAVRWWQDSLIDELLVTETLQKRKEKQKMPETEEVFYVYCRKCGDSKLCASKGHKEKLEQRNQEPLKGESLYTCRACIYSWL